MARPSSDPPLPGWQRAIVVVGSVLLALAVLVLVVVVVVAIASSS